MMFNPIIKTTVSNDIADQIISMIRSGALKSGEKLPSERILTEHFNVGRSSVREALKLLQAVGLIRRVRKGIIICGPSDEILPMFWLSRSQTRIHEVFETRKLLEIELAGLAAERANQKDIKKTAKTLIKTDKLEESIASDISFHLCVAESAHNSVLTQVYGMIAGLLFQTHKYHSILQQDDRISEQEIMAHRRRNYEIHKKIFHAIESHYVVGAREAMKEHLNVAEITLLDRLRRHSKKKENP